MDKPAAALLVQDLREQWRVMKEVFGRMEERRRGGSRTPEAIESLAYQIHNLYGALEQLFELIGRVCARDCGRGGVARPELIRSKEAAGREKDRLTLPTLRRLLERRSGFLTPSCPLPLSPAGRRRIVADADIVPSRSEPRSQPCAVEPS